MPRPTHGRRLADAAADAAAEAAAEAAARAGGIKSKKRPVAMQVHIEGGKGLPAGWRALVDPEGRPYYQNDIAKTTQWERPRERRNQSPPVSPRSPLQPLKPIEENILTDRDNDFSGSDIEEELGATFQMLSLRPEMPEERERQRRLQEFLSRQAR